MIAAKKNNIDIRISCNTTLNNEEGLKRKNIQ